LILSVCSAEPADSRAFVVTTNAMHRHTLDARTGLSSPAYRRIATVARSGRVERRSHNDQRAGHREIAAAGPADSAALDDLPASNAPAETTARLPAALPGV